MTKDYFAGIFLLRAVEMQGLEAPRPRISTA